jgi:5-methyltetrahydropteroyltriglutamate--homocysteine methyltransferase
MKRSTDRILTTHVGSLARPEALVPILAARDRGQPFDQEAYTRLVREAVADAVRRQTDAGVDVVTDGEQGKASFFGYVVERFTGFERQPAPPGQDGSTRAASREYRDYPEYYAWSERIAEGLGGRGNTRAYGVDVCTGPITYRGHAAVQADIATLKTAQQGRPHEEVFLPAIAPSYIFATLPNRHYRTDEEYEQALADALREEYRAIVDAGFVLQVDDPRLVTYYGRPGAWRRSTTRCEGSRPSGSAFTPATASTSARACTTWSSGTSSTSCARSGPAPSRSRRPTRGTSTSTTSSSSTSHRPG